MAISLQKMERTAPDLVKHYEEAGISLRKNDLAGQKAAVYLVLDHSGSMMNLYLDGTVQHFTEQVLGLSAQLDDDGTVPVVFFHDGVYPPFDVQIGQHRNAVNLLRQKHHVEFGMTNYAPAMRNVINHYRSSGATDPALVIFETDGQAGDNGEVEKLLRDVSGDRMFWQFVGFGEHGSREFTFLRKLDELKRRKLDNAGFFATGTRPRSLTDAQVYAGLVAEFSTWVREARAAGIL